MSFNTPFIAGTVLGRDHTYWPTNDNALSPAFPHCDLQQLMAVAWRIKEWTFSGEWSLTFKRIATGFPDLVRTVTYTFVDSPLAIVRTEFPENLGVRHPVVKEPLLASEFHASTLLNSFLHLRNSGFVSNTGTINDILLLAASGDALAGNWPATFFFFQYGSSLPYQSGQFQLPFDFFNHPFNFSFDVQCFSGFLASPPPNDSIVPFTIDPVIASAFTTPLIIDVTTPEGTHAVNLAASSTLKITASKFFPYQNSLGQAVYDENSGAQINDPFA